MRKILPEQEENKVSTKDVVKPESNKKPLPIKMIIIGAVGYIGVFALMMAGMVMMLKPDAPPLINTEAFEEAGNLDKTTTPEDPPVSVPAELKLEEPANVDISDLVDELKEIEYKSRLRDRMEQDSVARILAERETKIAEAKLQQLKLETAKIISARPKPKAATTKIGTTDKNQIVSTKNERSEQKSDFKQLAKIYESMKPAAAAKILDQMESKLVVNLLTNMKNRNAAKILSSFKPVKAARISKQMSRKLAQI